MVVDRLPSQAMRVDDRPSAVNHCYKEGRGLGDRSVATF